MAYQLIWVEVTPEGERYTGEYEACVAEYHSELGLTVETLVDTTYNQIVANGGTPLSFRVWRDGNNWKIEATAHGSPLALVWAVIIYAVIAVIVAFVVIALIRWGFVPLIKSVTELVRGYPPVVIPSDSGYTVTYPPSGISTTMILGAGAILIGGIAVAYLATRRK